MSRRFQVYLGSEYPDEEVAGESTLTGGFTLADWLNPIYMSQASNGEIGELRVIAHKHPEDAYHTTLINQAAQVLDFADDVNGVEVFNGVLVKEHLVWQGESELYEAIFYNNADYYLHRKVLHGQKRLSHQVEQNYADRNKNVSSTTAEPLALGDWVDIDTPLIFNPDGEPNMMKQLWWSADVSNDNTNPFRLFDRPFRYNVNKNKKVIAADYWTLKDAVQYLLTLHNAKWAVKPSTYSKTALAAIFDTYGNPQVSNVNLEGRSLLEGLRLLLEPHNYGFYCSTSTATGSSTQHSIAFYFRGNGPQKTIDLAARGTNAGVSNANMITGDIVYDYTSVVNTIKAVGARKSFTTLAHTDPDSTDVPAMKLVQGWNDGDLVWPDPNEDGTVNSWDETFRKDYCHPSLITVNDSGQSAYGVGRLWVVNQGENPNENLEDLTVDLNDNADGKCSIDPRRLEKPELYDRNSAGGVLSQEDIQVELSFDSGDNWCPIEKSWYRIISEGMGIVFITPELEQLGDMCPNSLYPDGWTYWDALHDDSLQIRIVCSVKSDERLVVDKYNDGSTTHLATERLYQNDGYKKVKYNQAALDSVFYTRFQPLKNNQDDTAAFQSVTDIQWENSNRVMTTGTAVVVLEEIGDYHPGDCITQISNRVGFGDYPSIVRVVYDLQNLHTQIALDSRKVATIIRSAHQDAESLAAHRLGIGQTSAAGGNQVPYLPGNMRSLRTYLSEGGEP